MNDRPLIEDHLLRSQWQQEYEEFASSGKATKVLDLLQAWAQRQVLKEEESGAAFIQRFFVELWGYTTQGRDGTGAFSCWPEFKVSGAGARGGKGAADAALGNFGPGRDGIPQVLCEFKDIRSGLDATQHRENTRSPVDQCLDYLREAYLARSRDALVAPSWALVTDMQEFRLYARRSGEKTFDKTQYEQFVLAESDDPRVPALLGASEAAAFRRFVFWRMLQSDMLLAERGSSRLDGLVRDQVVHEKAVEDAFYREYRAYREFVYEAIGAANPDFAGTRGKLVRLTQRFLDRCIFILFCEDMGRALLYPPALMKNLLIDYSNDRYYNPDDSAPWDRMRGLFRAMRAGGEMGEHKIPPFNGGLFEEDADLESLRIPAKVFCAKGQGSGGEDKLRAHPRTLLYFSAAYNFGVEGASGERVIGLTTLGRIFEQSITELEIMEAEADGRVSINRLTKRKTDGVYYTPEWVTKYIVEETIGARLADIKTELGFDELPPLDDEAIAKYRAFQQDGRRTAPVAGMHRDALAKYRARLDRFRIVDPACGSGAFLIQALTRLVAEYRWVAAEQERIEGHRQLFDQDEIIRSLLSHNIYGVDINPESVEITKLALWLHTAAPNKPLCALDRNIRCGNSLVGPEFAGFYRQKHDTLFEQANENERERINAFDWKAAFPDVFSHGGFDCVVGNPPYIKLQHFRRAQADVAEFLSTANRPDGTPIYESTRSGNFDMYLPFIEKGIELLKPGGRMGYIAPNVWMVNKYGQALRNKVKRTRALDRWLDFKSFQVFDEAITYTALQFFRGSDCEGVRCAFAPDGSTTGIEWAEAETVPYDSLPVGSSWALLPENEKRLLERLLSNHPHLASFAHEGAVGFRGIESGADEFYHFDRISNGVYTGCKKGSRKDLRGVTVHLEDEVLRPLVSSEDANRYVEPKTVRHTIFPYDVAAETASLISESELSGRFPHAWSWLVENEGDLRARDNRAMNTPTGWWRYTRPMNLEKQGQQKLGIPQTVQRLHAFFDEQGEYCFNNVRVGGILIRETNVGWFLLGVINSPVPDWVFRRIARPKEGGYFEANKQFIAPLPIPDAKPEERNRVGELAKELQNLHTRRRDLVKSLDDRLQSGQTTSTKWKPRDIWRDIGSVKDWKDNPEAPAELKGRALTAWAKRNREGALTERLQLLDALLEEGVRIEVENTDAEIGLIIEGNEVLRLFDKPDTPFLAAQWRHALRDVRVTQAFDGKRLLRLLLDLRTTADTGLRDRIVTLDTEIAALDGEIADRESEINALIYGLYKLEPDEIAMIEADRQ